MDTAHFLGNINEADWLDSVRTFILFSFGPVSRAYLRQYLRELRATPHKAFDLNAEDLRDFTVRPVDMDELLNTDKLEDFFEAIRASKSPLPVPAEYLGQVLTLCGETTQELEIGRLPIYPQGTLGLSVYLPGLFDERHFLVDGQIDLDKLAQDFPGAGPQ
jgi:hypothetical protein